jgi:hypothetical protein
MSVILSTGSTPYLLREVAGWALALDRLLQCQAAPLGPGRAHARRGLCGDRDGETGGLTATRTKLNQAAKLSEEAGPPHIPEAGRLQDRLSRPAIRPEGT